MAASAANGVTKEHVLSQVRAARDKNQLPSLHFSATRLEGDVVWKSICYVVRTREGGFMFALPHGPEVLAYFDEHAEHEIFAVRPCEVTMETSRGRHLGAGGAVLVDCSWDTLDMFRRAGALRGESSQQLLKFTFEGQFCKPSRDSTMFVAESWIAEEMDEDTAGDYVSCEDQPAAVEQPEASGTPDVATLMRRIQELEARVPPAAAPVAGQPTPQDGLLGVVPHGAQAPQPEVMQRLKMMAGAGPSRFAQHERAGRAMASIPEDAGQLEMVMQEHEREAVAEQEMNELMMVQPEEFQDPVQRLLAMQMKQIAMMNQQMAARQPSDAIHAALGNSNELGGGSSSGIKGCLAREAYLKVASNLVQINQTVQSNALQELGLGPGQQYPGLLRDYLEKRVPLGTFKLLTQVGYLMAHAYEVGARTGNLELQGFGSKGMIFVEQTALDEGRTSLSWLLTALPEPNFSQVQLTRAKTSVRPFSRLSSASWIAANVGYLRDLDFLETKIRASEKETPKHPGGEAKTKAEPKKWGKRGKKGKGEDPSSEASASV